LAAPLVDLAERRVHIAVAKGAGKVHGGNDGMRLRASTVRSLGTCNGEVRLAPDRMQQEESQEQFAGRPTIPRAPDTLPRVITASTRYAVRRMRVLLLIFTGRAYGRQGTI
jgi:hypothetical protein